MKKILIVCWAVLFAGCSPEPVVQGKRASPWREDLKSPSASERWRAVWALGQIGPPAKAAIPEITQLVKDPNPIVRFMAAEALGRFGPDAKSAIPVLREAMRDSSRTVREVARNSLRQVDPNEVVEEDK
jgi:HEAT repeat protein